MALAIDPSTPAITSGSTAAIASAAFTTPANVLLVALVGRDSASAGVDATGTVSGAGLTWTLAGRKSAVGATGQVAGGTAQPGCAEIWWAYSSTALTSVTVTDTRAGGPDDHAIQVMVITGAESTWGGAIAANGAASGLPTATLTTTAANSWVMACSTDWSAGGNATAGSGQTIISQFHLASQISIHFWRRTATTPTSGTSVTCNLTAPSGQQYDMLALEIREAPTSGTNVSLTGVVATLVTAAPAGTVAAQSNVAQAGTVANLATSAPAGTVSTQRNVALTGVVAPLSTSSPAGAVATQRNVALTGVVANLSTAAPAGTVSTGGSVSLTGVVTNLATSAPAGTVTTQRGVVLSGPAATLTTSAPAGSVSLGGNVNLTGAVATLTLAAPAGTVGTQRNVTLSGPVSAVALASVAGTVATQQMVALTGAVADLSLSAPAGTVLIGADPSGFVDVRILAVVDRSRTVTLTDRSRTVTVTEHPRPVTITDRS